MAKVNIPPFPPLPRETVAFVYKGGPYDGHISPVAKPPEMNFITTTWWNSKGGKVGFKFFVAAPARAHDLEKATIRHGDDGKLIIENFTPPQSHWYEICEHEDDGTTLIIRCKYLGVDVYKEWPVRE